MAVKHSTIESTLERGKYFSGWYSVLAWIIFALGISEVFGIIVVLLLYGFGIIYFNYLLILIIVSVVCAAGVLYAIYLIMRTRTHKRYIENLLQDAIELTASVKEVGESALKSGMFMRAVCIAVNFCYENKTEIKLSGTTVNGSFKKRYDRCFLKYCNKTVKILYSPTYDQVLFPKQNLMLPTFDEIEIRENR